MSLPSDLDPVLQIVHVSDLHVRHRDFRPPLPMLFFERLGQLPFVGKYLEEGVALHDEDAEREFDSFLRRTRTEWGSEATWLLDTGDLTTYGDQLSLMHGSSLLNRYQGEVNAGLLVKLYGNHDAWPSDFPLVSQAGDIAQHRNELRRSLYTETWPEPPSCAAFPSGNGELQLYALNSTLHDRYLNTLALGLARQDRHWERPGWASWRAVIEDIERKAAERNPCSLRVLAIHHPIHYPGGRPFLNMFLLNDRWLGYRLQRSRGSQPLVHLVLSGHTHDLHPEYGRLPPRSFLSSSSPLGPGQCQLVVGSLLQYDVRKKRGPFPFQAQLLRFYQRVSNPFEIWLTRTFVARGPAGGYGPVEATAPGASRDEAMSFQLSER